MTTWMREEPTGPSSEDYLLGKEVDKNFEQQGTMGQINAVEYDCTPESIFSSRAEHQVDLQRKLQEDPLIAIKKQELDTRKRVLDNPIKMRELKKHIKKAKKHKKNKKKKKKKKGGSSSDEDSESSGGSDQDLDMLLLKKLEDFDPSKSYGEKNSVDKKAPSSSSERIKRNDSSRSRSPERRKKRSYSPEQVRRRKRSRDRQPRSRSRDRQNNRAKHSRSRSRDRQNNRARQSRSRSRDLSGKGGGRRPRSSDERNKRSGKDEERERKLKEMMENAKWRDEQRTKNVKHYQKMDEVEEVNHKKDHNPEFIRKQLATAANSGTVEKRIQANKYNIQRGASSMDTNFARR